MYSQDEAGAGLEPLALLEPNQLHALYLLLEGRSMTETAERVDVHRSTIHRWMNKDHAFRAVYNRRLRQLQQNAFTRIQRLVHAALDHLEESLEAGELTPSETLRFLESAGALTGEKIDPGPTTIAELIHGSLERLEERCGTEHVRDWLEIVDEKAKSDRRIEGGTHVAVRSALYEALEEVQPEEEEAESGGSGTEESRASEEAVA